MEPDRHNRLTAMILILGAGLFTLARGMSLAFVAVRLQQVFELDPASIGMILGVGPLLGAIAGPFAGSLSDRLGRKPLLMLTLLSTGLSLVGMALAGSVLAFCLAQIVAAVALAIYEPLSRALMSDVCPVPQRLRYFSWRYTATNAGFAVGPLLGVFAGAASTVMFLVSALIYAAFGAAFLALRQPEAGEDRSAQTRFSLVGGMRAAIGDARLAFFIAGSILLFAVHGQWSATLAPYLAGSVKDGVDIFAYLMSINGIVVLLGNSTSRRLIERLGPLPSLVAGCLLLLAGELAFLASASFMGFAVAMTVFTLGEILVLPSEYMLVDDICGRANRGTYFGAHSFASVGNFIGPALGGLMLSRFGGAGMFLLYAGFAAAGAVLFRVGTRMPPPKAAATLPDAVVQGGSVANLRTAFA